MYKEKRYVFGELRRDIDECEMEELGAVDSSKKTSAIPGDR